MSTRDIVFIALFAALMAVLGAFPMLVLPIIAVPITAQSMGPMLAGGILGAKRGALAILLFCLLVAIGLPLLAGGRGGIAPFVGPWSGFIYGWIVAAFVTGALTERYIHRITFLHAFLFAAIGGIGVVYAIGVPWFAAVSGVDLVTAFKTAAIAFIPGDLIKAGLAAAIVVTVAKAYPLLGARAGSRAG